MKTIESKIAPNPKEAQIWVDLSADPHGTIRKIWNGKRWISNSTNNDVELIKEINEIKNTVHQLNADIEKVTSSHDQYLLNLIRQLSIRIEKLEKQIIIS